MESRRLKHVVALADVGNFAKAAQDCHLSASAFSRSIQAAEEELGMQLFDRRSADIKCTPAGAFVVERARRLLFEQRSLEREINLYRDRVIGDIAVGAGPYPASTLMPCLLTHIRKQYPQVNVRVEVNNPEYLLQRLRAEELDFYIADLRFTAGELDLEVEPVGSSAIGFFVRPGHPLLTRNEVQPEDAYGYGIATVYLPAAARAWASPLFAGSRPLQLVLESNDLHLLQQITIETDTVLVSPIVATQKAVEDGLLVQIPLARVLPLQMEMAIVSLKGRILSPMAQLAIDHLVKFCITQTRAL